MNLHNTFIITLLFLLAVSCNSNKKDNNIPKNNVIDIEEALRHTETIYLSDIASNVEMISLETNDSVLIGRYPLFTILKDNILVSSDGVQTLMCFDRKTGKHICNIGHKGNDPLGYKDPKLYWVDEPNGIVYFSGWGINDLQMYDLKGNYIGKETLDIAEKTSYTSQGNTLLFDDKSVYVHNNGSTMEKSTSLSFLNYDKDSKTIKDSIECYTEAPTPANILGLSVIKRNDSRGSFMIDFKDGTAKIFTVHIPSMWRIGEEIHMHKVDCDTIYGYKNGQMYPSTVFSLGQNKYDVNNPKDPKSIKLDYILENGNTILFYIYQSITPKDISRSLGVYDKKSGITKIMSETNIKDKDGLVPDFEIVTCTSTGEFASFIQAEKLLNHIEDNGLEKREEWLKKLKEDDNPVVLIFKQ